MAKFVSAALFAVVFVAIAEADLLSNLQLLIQSGLSPAQTCKNLTGQVAAANETLQNQMNALKKINVTSVGAVNCDDVLSKLKTAQYCIVEKLGKLETTCDKFNSCDSSPLLCALNIPGLLSDVESRRKELNDCVVPINANFIANLKTCLTPPENVSTTTTTTTSPTESSTSTEATAP